MDLQEMRSIRDVVNESLEESSLAFEDELQAALLVSCLLRFLYSSTNYAAEMFFLGESTNGQ